MPKKNQGKGISCIKMFGKKRVHSCIIQQEAPYDKKRFHFRIIQQEAPYDKKRVHFCIIQKKALYITTLPYNATETFRSVLKKEMN